MGYPVPGCVLLIYLSGATVRLHSYRRFPPGCVAVWLNQSLSVVPSSHLQAPWDGHEAAAPGKPVPHLWSVQRCEPCPPGGSGADVAVWCLWAQPQPVYCGLACPLRPQQECLCGQTLQAASPYSPNVINGSTLISPCAFTVCSQRFSQM